MSTVENLGGAPLAHRHLVVVPDVSTVSDLLAASEVAAVVDLLAGSDVVSSLGVAPRDAPARPRPAFPIDDGLWQDLVAIAPEVARRRRQTGRRRRDDRAVLEGILHVLSTGIAWRELPQELDCGSGVTCWRRLREWVDSGTWSALEPRLQAVGGLGVAVDWQRPWAGAGRPVPATAPLPAAHDPGATELAVRRRLTWAGPSLV
jgi:transposase